MTALKPKLVLASASPRRLEILRQLGLDAEVVPASVDESLLPDETPAAHVERLARAKAEVVSVARPGALVIGGDTVVVSDGAVLGKPQDVDEAVRTLTGLAGRSHEVLSGVAVAGEHGVVSAVARAVVRFRAFDEQTARRYAETREPLDKAGSYGIQGLGAALVAGTDGDYYAVVGLPVGTLLDLLEQAGWRYAFGRLLPGSI
jgi:septum formation protein